MRQPGTAANTGTQTPNLDGEQHFQEHQFDSNGSVDTSSKDGDSSVSKASVEAPKVPDNNNIGTLKKQIHQELGPTHMVNGTTKEVLVANHMHPNMVRSTIRKMNGSDLKRPANDDDEESGPQNPPKMMNGGPDNVVAQTIIRPVPTMVNVVGHQAAANIVQSDSSVNQAPLIPTVVSGKIALIESTAVPTHVSVCGLFLIFCVCFCLGGSSGTVAEASVVSSSVPISSSTIALPPGASSQNQGVIVTSVPQPINPTQSNPKAVIVLQPQSMAASNQASSGSTNNAVIMNGQGVRINGADNVPVSSSQPQNAQSQPQQQNVIVSPSATTDQHPHNRQAPSGAVVVNNTDASANSSNNLRTSASVSNVVRGSVGGGVVSQVSLPKPNPHSPFLCEWQNCMRSFRTPKEVENHAIKAHCPLGQDDIPCLWLRCDGMKRKRFSLMTHIQDRHCHPQVSYK